MRPNVKKSAVNEAFLIDMQTRNALVKADPNCAGIIRKYLRGQDIHRWRPDRAGLWMIVLKSSENYLWPWSDSVSTAEGIFSRTFPSICQHMKTYEESLRKRQDKGRYWWELRTCANYNAFESQKVFYQVIQFHPSYCIDDEPMLGNDKTFLLPTLDLLAVLNSPQMWWYTWRHLPLMKGEALSPMAFKMEELPIARPNDQQRAGIEKHGERILTITAAQQTTAKSLLDWLKVEYEIVKPSQKHAAFVNLDSYAWVAEVKKVSGAKKPLSPAALAAWREEHAAPSYPPKL